MCVALYNHELSMSGLCPAAANVRYNNGWFSVSRRKSHRRKDLTEKAETLLSSGYRAVYDMTYRSYALHVNGKKLL